MDTKHELELTIRTAQAIKSLTSLVGCSDAMLAKLMFREIVDQLDGLGKFIMALDERPKAAPRK